MHTTYIWYLSFDALNMICSQSAIFFSLLPTLISMCCSWNVQQYILRICNMKNFYFILRLFSSTLLPYLWSEEQEWEQANKRIGRDIFKDWINWCLCLVGKNDMLAIDCLLFHRLFLPRGCRVLLWIFLRFF